MKAILEFEAPNSCRQCIYERPGKTMPNERNEPVFVFGYLCGITGDRPDKGAFDNIIERAPGCPLKITGGKMSYDEAKKTVSHIFIWFFIRLLVGCAINFTGMMIAYKLLPYGRYWAFMIMYIFGVLFCCIDIFITRGKR